MAADLSVSRADACCSTWSPAARTSSSARSAIICRMQARYARSTEFLDIVRQLWSPASHHRPANSFSSTGVTGARPDPLPAVFFGGSSPTAGRVAAQHADIYLSWGEPPPQVARRSRGYASSPRRRVGRCATASGCTSSPATPPSTPWAEAHRMLSALGPQKIAVAQQASARSVSVGQQRMRDLHAGYGDFGRRGRPIWRSTPICGPASGWSWRRAGTALVGRIRKSPSGSRNMPHSASSSSSSPATRTWKRPTSSARACARAAQARAGPGSRRSERPAGRERVADDPGPSAGWIARRQPAPSSRRGAGRWGEWRDSARP